MLALQAAGPTPVPTSSLAMEGAEAEGFLRTAKVVKIKGFDTKGVTMPRRAELSDGERRVRAIFKDIDKYSPKETLKGGQVVMRFRDRYQHEIAAYELDKLLELGIVPPCVQRRIRAETGALCLWVEGTMTEWERRMEKKIDPPDLNAWRRQMATVQLFLQLIADIDYQNISNILVNEEFKVYKIDSSRAFRNDRELRKEEAFTRFSRSVLDALRRLTNKDLDTLKPWLTKDQIKGLMARRDAILELAEKRIAERGEAAVLFP
jgi:hypothetical protein